MRAHHHNNQSEARTNKEESRLLACHLVIDFGKHNQLGCSIFGILNVFARCIGSCLDIHLFLVSCKLINPRGVENEILASIRTEGMFKRLN